MDLNHVDPIDHSRTTRQHAGETMKNGANAPGLILVALSIITLFMSLAAFATGRNTPGLVGVGIAVVLGAAGATWLFLAHRRIRQHELRLADSRPHVEAPPPTS